MDLAAVPYAGRLALAGSVAYVATATDGVRVVDVSTATSPTVLSTLQPGGLSLGVTASGGLAAVATLNADDATGTVQLYDVTNPRVPVPAGQIVASDFRPESASRFGHILHIFGRNTPPDYAGPALELVEVGSTGAPGALDCDDHNPCTADSCDPSGGCAHTAVSDGISCSDGNACTATDTCLAGVCQGVGAISCDDGNVCTTDSCDSVGGCLHTAVSRCGYVIEDLGNLHGDSEAFAINGVGRVVGVSGQGTSETAFYTDKHDFGLTQIANPFGDWYFAADVASDGRIALGSAYVGWILEPGTQTIMRAPPPFWPTNRTFTVGINDTGMVLACADNGGHAQMYVWDTVKGHTTLIPGADNLCIGKINNTGLAVANSGAGAGGFGFLFNYGTNVTQHVPSLGGQTIAYDLDDAGVVVGSSHNGSGQLRAFVWQAGTEIAEDIGTLGGAQAEARGIGVNTNVVGAADTAGGQRHAFVWRTDWGMIDLGTLTGDTTSIAYGVNASGVIVGSSGEAGARHAVRWVPNLPTDCSGLPDNSPCDDGDACSQSDTCQAGACVGAYPVVCNAVDQCHRAGSCDPSTGLCSNPVAGKGTICSDGNACTKLDFCQAGVCVGGSPVVCALADQCRAEEACDPSNGQCLPGSTAPNGTPCDDGVACTGGDKCQAGVCAGYPGGAVRMLVADQRSGAVFQYDLASGTLTGTFVEPGLGGISSADGLALQDGYLFVSNYDPAGSTILRYDQATGAPAPAPGNPGARFAPVADADPFKFGRDGNIYTATNLNYRVDRYDGETGVRCRPRVSRGLRPSR